MMMTAADILDRDKELFAAHDDHGKWVRGQSKGATLLRLNRDSGWWPSSKPPALTPCAWWHRRRIGLPSLSARGIRQSSGGEQFGVFRKALMPRKAAKARTHLGQSKARSVWRYPGTSGRDMNGPCRLSGSRQGYSHYFLKQTSCGNKIVQSVASRRRRERRSASRRTQFAFILTRISGRRGWFGRGSKGRGNRLARGSKTVSWKLSTVWWHPRGC